MIEEISGISNLDKQNLQLWRYMSIEKFYSILNKSSLYFSRSDDQNDKKEGTYTFLDYEVYNEHYRIPGDPNVLEIIEKSREYTYLSCWRIDKSINDRAFNEYISGKNGVAIKTDYSKLSNALDKKNSIKIIPVIIKYLQREKEMVGRANFFFPYIFKNYEEFNWEQEFRLIVQLNQQNSYNPDDKPIKIDVGVNLNELIDSVYIKDETDTTFRNEIENRIKPLGLRLSSRK